MFLAASTRCFADLDFAAACTQVVDVGFDRVELWLDEASSHLKPTQVGNDPEAFVAHYRDITRLTPTAFCLAHDVPRELFQGISKAAKLLRITQLTVPASPLGTPFNSEIDRLRDLVRIAGGDGVRVSIKTQTGQLTEDPRTAVELCQAVSALGLTLDPTYYLGSPLGERACDLAYPYTFHVHLRDSTPQQIQVLVGLGDTDYNRLIAQLRRFGYNRALSIELLPELLQSDQRPLEMRKMRMLLETLL